MSVGDRLLALARQHMGLAANAYITSELRAMGRSRSEIDGQVLRLVAGRARTTALRFMDERDADAFARDVEALADEAGTSADEGETVDHRLALDAAERLLARGDSRRSYLAYKELAERHGDAGSFRGLARAAIASGDTEAAVEGLRDASLRLVQAGSRDQAISLLEEAVVLAPTELAIHRRLVALYANAGDVTSSKHEHARFVEACLEAGDTARAQGEIEYARQTIGDSPALRDLERRVAVAPAGRPGPRLVVVPPPVAAPAPAVAVAIAPAVVAAPAPAPAPKPPPAPVPVSAASAEERAMTLIAQRDDRACVDCLAAARELMDARKPRAAADLLLAHVASGLPGRDVQRLLIRVDRELGRSDIAAEKARLLARVLELDGDHAGAGEVRQIALAS